MIGIFSGLAILNKWLVGLLPYLGWGLNLVNQSNKGLLKMEIRHLIASLLICSIIFLPWHLYTWYTYPELTKFEHNYNWRHITEALEGHYGSIYYYLEHFREYFGKIIYYLIPVGIVLMLLNPSTNQRLLKAFLVEAVSVFCFFSFIAKTKVDTHFYFIVPILILFIAVAIHKIIGLKFIKDYSLIFILLIVYLTYDPLLIRSYLSGKNTTRNDRIYNTYIYQHLSQYIPDTSLVMNMNAFEDIDVMFYNNKMTAYHFTLPEEGIPDLLQRKVPIYAFTPHGKYTLPEWIECYPYLKIINFELKTSKL